MKNLVVIVFSLLLFGSCTKQNDTSSTVPINNNFYYSLDTSIIHYKFKVGSYWVYRNDSTAVLDSITTDSIETGYNTIQPGVMGGSGSYGEYYKMKMHSFATNQYYADVLWGSNIVRNGTWNSYGWHPYVGTPIFQSNCDTGTVWSAMKIIAKFPSMTINSNTFYTIVESKITASLQLEPDFAHDTYLFYSPSVGLIKKEEDLGGGNIQSWSILRWHVVR